ncbi:keratin, type I cytoskeletal 18-like [Anguilla rostrata]|uniref:keratin, type I cytoskeletal 18-like n=1 Tax=Anguilla rostrata TaxID=7938 RepID=UPI0030D19DC0
MFSVDDERETMQGLNDRLASYLEKVRGLEQANNKLELQNGEALEKRCLEVNDYSRYDAILEDLRKQVLERISGKENLAVSISKLISEADDFQMKEEMEKMFWQSSESDIAGFRNLLDNINGTRMKLEKDIKALNEELTLLKKNHMERCTMRKVIGEIRAKFEKMALKNQEELKASNVLKVSEVEAEVAENTTALQVAQNERKEKHRLMQSLEIDIHFQKSQTCMTAFPPPPLQKGSLEATLRDTELRYNMEIEKYNNIILQLETELTELRTNIQHQTQEYEALLNIKMKLEAEIATYRRLLDGGDF